MFIILSFAEEPRRNS